MARGDPTDTALLRLELRRFASRCDGQEGLIRRADSLREISRLAFMSPPYRIAGELETRDLLRRLSLVAEERAREIVQEQIDGYLRAEPDYRQKFKGKMHDDWANLTGPLAHLRSWAQNKLNLAEQSR
ncbi:MAG TPA: hypothetical protein VMB75_02610 [Rhodocyclaceae bacterium]|nr:hypothetical protein [Rhodocyclaceae bacterium]